MKKCVVCKKNIFTKRVELKGGDYCHKKCYYETNEGKSYLNLVNARSLFYEGKLKESLKIVDYELKINPKILDFLELKGKLLMTNNPKEALFFLEKAYKRNQEIYGENFQINKMQEIRENKESQDWFFKNKYTITSYEDLLDNLINISIRLRKKELAKKYFKQKSLLMQGPCNSNTWNECLNEFDNTYNKIISNEKLSKKK